MNLDRTLISKSYVRNIFLLMLLVIGVLIWMTFVRQDAFYQQHLDIARGSTIGLEKQVSSFIVEKQRLVGIFAYENIELIQSLANDSENDLLHDQLGKLISLHFPESFAFSVADSNGNPMFEDFDGFVSGLCLGDIQQFAEELVYDPYIHPNTDGYHFDVMVHYGKEGEKGILFISFLADVMGSIIKSIQNPEHRLMLVYPERNDLIEVIDDGARIHLKRDDYRLSEKDKSLIIKRLPVAGTRWEAVDFQVDGLFQSYNERLIIESLVIFSLFVFISFKMVARLREEEIQRELIEKQRTALLGVVSHEFRSPVTAIKGVLDILVQGEAGEVTDEAKEFLNLALGSTAQLLFLTNDFMDLKKMESGKLQFNMKNNHLKSIVQGIVKVNMSYARQFDVKYQLIEPLDEAVVSCDCQRIEQVLTNLLSNAAKYGGKEDTVEVTMNRRDGKIRVCVTDHGPGIPEDFRGEVFEEFTMAKISSGNQKVNSSGIGLSIAKEIIERQNGTIGFDTVEGIGTTFWFELPIATVG